MAKEESNTIELPIIRSKNKTPRKREVVFQKVKKDSPRTAFLKYVDTKAPAIYRIPLGQVKSVPQDEARKDWDNILIPVVPLRFATYHKDKEKNKKLAQPLRKGWLYIFKDGYFWREFEVMDKHHFSEVNLEKYQNGETRTATIQTDNRIILPYKVMGEEPKIQIAFSEVQWSWARINAMGGMSKDDPRLDVNMEKIKKGSSEIKVYNKSKTRMPSKEQIKNAAALRKQRMGPPIDLSSYKTKFTDSDGLISVPETPNTYSATLHHKKNIPILYLHDTMGIAADKLKKYIKSLADLIKLVEQAKNHKHFATVLFTYKLFYDEKNLKNCHVKSGKKVCNDNDDLINAKKYLSEDYIAKKILKKDERKKVRKKSVN